MLKFFLAIILCIFAFAIIWRLCSCRTSIPCPSWLGWLVELDNPLFRNNRAAIIIEHLQLQPGMRVLDFGCGPGRLTLPLARCLAASGQVTALDVQPEMLEKVRAKIVAEQLINVTLRQAAVGASSLEPDFYDCVLLVTVLGEIPDKQSVLKEIYACLKNRGIMSITEVIADPHFMRRQSVCQLAATAGFIEQEFFGNSVSYTINFAKA